jgi:dGTPase
MIEKLYFFYEDHIEMLPEQFQLLLRKGDLQEQVVCDYIAGMTDNYAVKKFEEIFVPQAWKI